MIKMNMGDEPLVMDTKFVQKLARKLEGYSGADISIIARDVLMAPIREAMRATHWKKVLQIQIKNCIDLHVMQVPNPKNPVSPLFTPCEPNEPEAIEMNLMQLNSDQLLLPQLKQVRRISFFEIFCLID